MASTPPVPSRAALNALRGVLFTTSCSVALLAEERRRRLKLARSAIDNARKLHTVKSNRGAVALSESWEDRLADLGDEVLSLPSASRTKNPYRRRRRGSSANSLVLDGAASVHRHSFEHHEHTSRAASGDKEQKSTEEIHMSNFGLEATKFILPLTDIRPSDISFKPLTAPTISALPLRSQEMDSQRLGTGLDTRVKVSLHRDYEPIPRRSKTQDSSFSLHEPLQFDSSAPGRRSLANISTPDKTDRKSVV